MVWIWVVLIVLVVGAAVVIAVGRDDAMAEVYDDRPDVSLPAGRSLTADDLDHVRFSTAVRGYRMDEVDAFVARVAADLIVREERAAGEAAAQEAAAQEAAAREAAAREAAAREAAAQEAAAREAAAGAPTRPPAHAGPPEDPEATAVPEPAPGVPDRPAHRADTGR